MKRTKLTDFILKNLQWTGIFLCEQIYWSRLSKSLNDIKNNIDDIETKYYKVEERYIKVVNENQICCVFDTKIIPSIDYNMIPRHYLIVENEIEWDKFYEVFDRVHQMLRDLLLDIQYNKGSELTPTIAQLVRNYDRCVQYIECSGQRRTQEEKNNKILYKLKELGVKSFEGITISTPEAKT